MARALPYRDTEMRRAREVVGYVGLDRAQTIAFQLHKIYEAIGRPEPATYWWGVRNALKSIVAAEKAEQERRESAKYVKLKTALIEFRDQFGHNATADLLGDFQFLRLRDVPPSSYDDVLKAVEEETAKRYESKREQASKLGASIINAGAADDAKQVLRTLGYERITNVPDDQLDSLIEGYKLALTAAEKRNEATAIRGYEKRASVLTPKALADLGYRVREVRRRLFKKYQWQVVDLRNGSVVERSNAGPGVVADRFMERMGIDS